MAGETDMNAQKTSSEGAEQKAFSSQEIYKSKSQQGGDIFAAGNKQPTRSQKFWKKVKGEVKGNKKKVVGFGVVLGVLVLISLALWVILMINQRRDEGGTVEQMPEPEVNLIDTEDETQAVAEVLEHYEGNKDAAIDYINSQVQNAVKENKTAVAASIVVATALNYALQGKKTTALEFLGNADLTELSKEDKIKIATTGMSIAAEKGDDETYKYWSDVYIEQGDTANGGG